MLKTSKATALIRHVWFTIRHVLSVFQQIAVKYFRTAFPAYNTRYWFDQKVLFCDFV